MTRSATSRSCPDGLGTAASSRKRSRTSDTRLSLRGGYSIAAALPRTLERSRDELAEERRRARGPRLELRMELRRDEPGMVGKLDDLDEPSLLERPADDEPRIDELLPECVVHLVAVAVALGDAPLAAVDLARPRVLRELDCLGAEAHRPAEILDVLLLRQQVDHGERRLGIHLG